VFSKLSKMFPEVKLTTFGAFADRELQEDILKFSSDNISINGTIEGKEKFYEIANSDCLILPSWNEGQPIVLLEAMSVGTPVIATKSGLIPEILGNEYPFVSIPGDRISLESKIIQFMHYKDLIQLSRELFERYLKTYSQKKHIEMLKNIFE
jgi:glycosyltransferase involved in cell wall biosynthesis